MRFALAILFFLAGCAAPSAPSSAPTTASAPAPQAQAIQAAPAAAIIHAIKWAPNPPEQQISAYRVYQVVRKAGVLRAVVSAPPYRPSKKGTYYITAVNSRAESPPSRSVTL